MNIARIITATLAALALSGAALATAGPALADGSPVNVAATVNQSITMAGITGSIALAGDPGTTATNANAETYTITTNDTNGYAVTVTPTNNNLADAKSDLIPDNKLSVNTGAFPFPAAPLTVHSKAGASAMAGDPYTDSWALAIPTGQPSGTYQGSFTYLATAS